MGTKKRAAVGTAVLLSLFAATAQAAETRKEFKYTVAPGGSVAIINEQGPITIKGGPGRLVTIVATTHSDKMEIDANQYGKRVDVRTRELQRAGQDEGRVEYEVTVPQDVAVTVRTAAGPVRIERMRADTTVEADSAQVEVRDSSNAHVHVRTLSGPITLTNINNGHVEVASVSGDVRLSLVTGLKLSANTTRGNIFYDGSFAGGGDYSFINGSGNIELSLPASASIDLTARSINGSVENDFPLQQKGNAVLPASARTLVGTSHTASSSVEVRSFSGKIRVKKQ